MNTRIIRFLLGTTIALAIAMLLFVLPRPASSAPTGRYLIHVTTTTDEYDVAGNGTGCSLREAIKTANDGVNFGGCARIINPIGFGADTIVLPSGTYTLTLSGSGEDLDATGDLDIRNSMIIGTSSATPPIVTGDPNWTDRIFHILIGIATINSIVIRGGWEADVGGGAVRIESGASLIMNNSVVADSFAIGKYGGGIYNNSGTLSLNNVTLTNDRTTGSGQYGGGLYNFNGSATLTDVILSGNQASGEGGGVYNLGTLILISDTLSGNSADVYGVASQTKLAC